MMQDFDKLITDAAPPIPDSGPNRCMARAELHVRMRKDARRQRVRHLRGISLAASLVILVVMGGQVTQLGGDGFDFELGTLEIGNGETVPLIKNKVRGNVGSALPGMNEADIRELQQQSLLREGVIEHIFGFAFNGDVPWWRVSYLLDVNGTIVHNTREPLNLSVASQVPPRSTRPFLASHLDEFLALVDSGQLEARLYGIVTANGLSFEVHQWSREYPEWGIFTYYRGLPIDR